MKVTPDSVAIEYESSDPKRRVKVSDPVALTRLEIAELLMTTLVALVSDLTSNFSKFCAFKEDKFNVELALP